MDAVSCLRPAAYRLVQWLIMLLIIGYLSFDQLCKVTGTISFEVKCKLLPFSHRLESFRHLSLVVVWRMSCRQ